MVYRPRGVSSGVLHQASLCGGPEAGRDGRGAAHASGDPATEPQKVLPTSVSQRGLSIEFVVGCYGIVLIQQTETRVGLMWGTGAEGNGDQVKRPRDLRPVLEAAEGHLPPGSSLLS